MDKEKLYEFIVKYNLIPEKRFFIWNNKIEILYTLANGSCDCEYIMEKSKEEGLTSDFSTLAYEAYCLLNIKYSQENEFFID